VSSNIYYRPALLVRRSRKSGYNPIPHIERSCALLGADRIPLLDGEKQRETLFQALGTLKPTSQAIDSI
jgi:hypothetical protein